MIYYLKQLLIRHLIPRSSQLIISHPITKEALRHLSTISTQIKSEMDALNATSAETSGEKHDDDQRGTKRKYNDSCAECRKAHKACDRNRPCERCVKLGIADRCESTVRKKRNIVKKRWYNIEIDQGMNI
jgi:hypothetical protein